MVVMGAQQYKCTECHCTVHLNMIKMLYFMLCVFYHNGKRKKQQQQQQAKTLLLWTLHRKQHKISTQSRITLVAVRLQRRKCQAGRGKGWRRRTFRAEATSSERLRETWDPLIIENFIFFMPIRDTSFCFLFSVHFFPFYYSAIFFFQRPRLTKGEWERLYLYIWVPERLVHRSVTEEEHSILCT